MLTAKSFKSTLLTAIAGLVFLTACDNENNMDTASLMVSDQTISQNKIMVSNIDVPADGWVVVHKDNGSGGPVVPGIVSTPVQVSMGTNMDVEVPLDMTNSFSDGETLWIMLHMDDGTIGTYEFDGQNGFDAPYTDMDGNVVMKNITITAPSITVSDQPVMNNSVTIPEVNAAADGWLVVHNDDGTGNIVLPDIIGKTMVSEGINTNVVVNLDTSETYTQGQLLFPMLHLDNGQIGVYEFDGNSQFDGPEIFSNDPFPMNVIFTSFSVQ